eukprot:GHUV01023903.1.p2 GENE.GHUV01023903.1~~GHUV01023903.1.p2  ORF type:complete len:353 (+),score=122.06 GHUV01023903.1:2027-3085(+)
MLNTTGVLPRVGSTGASLNLAGAVPSHGQLAHGSITLGSPKASNLSMQYSAEAELVRRQTAMLVQLMQMPAAIGQSSRGGLSADDLQAARLLLCVQTGGNGWFLMSKLRELIVGNTSSHSGAADTARSTGSRHMGSAGAHHGLGRHVSVSDTGFGGPTKPRPEVACHNSKSEANLASLTDRSHSKPSSHKSHKSGSTLRSTSPIQTKLMEGVDSLASVMASAFSAAVMSRSASLTRPRSPRHSAEYSAGPAQKVKWQASSNPAPVPPSEPPAAQQQQPAETAAANNSSTMSGNGSAAASPAQRTVSAEAFEVLAEMMNSLVEVAAVQDDYRVALAALELSCVITCDPGGSTL